MTSHNKFASISFANHLISNYTYYTNYTNKDQLSAPINIIQASAEKKIKLKNKIFLYSEITAQQATPARPITVPLVYTRNRLVFEGKFYRNLNLTTGLEVRYYTPYKAYNYSPLNGQFLPQDSIRISNLPDVAAFLHFRIKGFSGFFRAENLNTIYLKNGFSFANNNFAAPRYPTQGQLIRFGIRWWFIN